MPNNSSTLFKYFFALSGKLLKCRMPMVGVIHPLNTSYSTSTLPRVSKEDGKPQISRPSILYATASLISSKVSKTSNLIKVYNFNTSWCGYSVRFQPEWEKFEKEINSIDNLSIQAFDIKCDNINNKQMCNDYEISGFPTIIIEKDGKKINYNGLRTVEAIIETIQNL